MKKVLALISTLLLGASMQAYAITGMTTPSVTTTSAEPHIAVVNVQQVLQQSPKVAELSKKLQDQFKARQEKLDGSQKALQEQLEKFKKDAPTMAAKDRDSLQKKITDDRANLVKEVVAFQQDLNKEQGKVMQGILNQLNGIISGLAKKNNYTLVLDAQAVVFATDAADITKQVSKDFNKQ